MKDKICKNCMFFIKDKNNINQGNCQRFPPNTQILPDLQKMKLGLNSMVAQTTYPYVSIDMFCGEFKTSSFKLN